MTWGARSKRRVATANADLRKWAAWVDSHWSSTVLDGRRGMAQQRENVAAKVSQTLESLHLDEYSKDPVDGVDALDVAPDPLRWPQLKKRTDEIDKLLEALARDGLTADDRKEIANQVRESHAAYAKELGRWYAFCGYGHAVGDWMLETGQISRPLRHGYDWDGDHILTDQKFDDLPHTESKP